MTTFESSLYFELNDGPTIIGRPDAVHFREALPQLVVERKFARSPKNLYENHKMQAWFYSFLLDKAGFDAGDLRSLVLRFPSDPDTVQPVGRLAIERAILADESELPRRTRVLEQFDVWAHLRPCDPVEWLNELDHAIEFWRGDRLVEPTDVAVRCRYCDYEDVCPDSKV